MRRPLAVDQHEIQRVRDAVAKHLSGTIQIAGGMLKIDDLLGDMDAALSTFAAAREAQAALRQAQAERAAAVASMRQRINELKGYLRVRLGTADPRLGEFGFVPKVRRKLTSQEKALKAAKARLTRNVRGTKGPKQKREITAEGRPGLLLVDAEGTPMPGVVKGPVPARQKKGGGGT